MKRKILVAALATLFSGAALAAGNTGTTTDQGSSQGAAQPQTGQEKVMPSVGGAAPVSKHQGRETAEIKRRFDVLDKDHDGKLSAIEAQADPALAKYWQKQGMGRQSQMSESEFARFESVEATGTNIYDSGRQGLPATQHQKKATGQGTVEVPGTSKSNPQPGATGSQ